VRVWCVCGVSVVPPPSSSQMLLFALAVPSLLVAPAPVTSYGRLQGVQLARASDASPVELTSLWRKDIAFGLGGERVVVCFLRHFG